MTGTPPPETHSRDDLRQQVHELRERVETLQSRADRHETILRNLLTVNAEDATSEDDLAYLAATLDPAERGDIDDLREEFRTAEDRLHCERSKLARRVAALEEELGIAATDALATAEGGSDDHRLSKLGRLVRYGPAAVAESPTATTFRARELVENWNRWGTIRDDALGRERRLASKQHDLKTRLEDARDESLAWRQVYRAMELVAEWSDGTVTLEEGSDEEGQYVLVHRLDDDCGDEEVSD